MAAAAQGDPEIAAAHAGLQERIRADFLKVAGFLQQRGGLRTDVPLEEVALMLWLLTSPYQHEHLVVQAGWTSGALPRLAGTGPARGGAGAPGR